MQSSLLHTHCLLGTERGAPLRAGLGIAISRSLSGEEHCGHVGVEFVMSLSSRSRNRQGWMELEQSVGLEHSKIPHLQGFFDARGAGSVVAYPIAATV
jgi:hypothetical protein